MEVQCDFCKEIVAMDFIEPGTFFAITFEDVKCEVGGAWFGRKIDLCSKCVVEGRFTEVFARIWKYEKELELIEP